jgi:general secretion pathway protein D
LKNAISQRNRGSAPSRVLLAGLAVLNAADGQWSINLRDADIRTFIDQVSAMTGKTFVVDQRVKGKITVIAPESMNSATVYQVFLSVLQCQRLCCRARPAA